jgi:hypothetical protein
MNLSRSRMALIKGLFCVVDEPSFIVRPSWSL